MHLKTQKLAKNFGGLQAVNFVDFEVKKGQLKSIIGPNGAGKTTFFNLIAGVHLPSSGKIFFEGRDITRKRLHQISQLGIVKTYQITHIFPRLTVFENVRISAQSRNTSFNFWKRADVLEKVNERTMQILAQIGMADSRDRLASVLSHGERKYLEIGIALATDPKVLLLDEPTAGMSPAETRAATRLIRDLAERLHLTVILVEHDMSVVMEISDEITVLHEGRVLAEGSPQQISDNELVQRIYLGARR
jgi:branched-chain amino acid transport system ATP-binding protein